MRLNFREITFNDIDRVSAIEDECFSRPWPRHAFEEIVTKEDATYYLAEDLDENIVVGGCVLFHIVDEGDIMNVAVTKKYRGHGIATKLLEYAMECGRKEGIKDFTLEVRVSNKAAIRVYEKNGFTSDGIRPGFYENPKEDAYVMWNRQKED